MSDALNIAFNAEVDAIGMNCPLPILRTKKALATMQSGEVLKIKATDAGAEAQVVAFNHNKKGREISTFFNSAKKNLSQ